MRASLGRNVLINAINVVASLAASLATLPFILHRVGTAGYGVWVIGFTFVLYLTIADNGFGPAIQRWVGIAHGGGDSEPARRVLWTALAGYSVVGALAGAGVALGAQLWTDLFVDAGSPLRADAVPMFRLVGLALVLTLWLTALQNVLQGFERFSAITLSSLLGSLTYVAGVLAFVGSGMGLRGLGWALVAQQGVVALTRAVALRGVLAAGRPGLIARAERRAIATFAAKLQLNAFAALINGQSDKVVVGLVASTRSLGELGIASQLVDAGRLVATAALTPIVSALAVTVGSGDEQRLRLQFAWMQRTWFYAIGGGTVIGLGALAPVLEGWLGDHHEAIVLGLILVAANGISLLTGPGLAYLRAVGRPQLEASFGPLILLLNVVLTVPLGFAFGARGVVGGTLGAYALGTLWFLRHFHAAAPDVDRVRAGELVRPAVLALAAGGACLGIGLACVAAFPRGIALAPVAAAGAVVYLVYLSLVTGRPLTPSGVRELVAGLRGAPA